MKFFTQVQFDLYTWVHKDELLKVLRDNTEPHEKVPSVSFSLICMEKPFYGHIDSTCFRIVPVTLGLALFTPIIEGTIWSNEERTRLNIVSTMTRFAKGLLYILLILSAVSFFLWSIPILLGFHPIVNILSSFNSLFLGGLMLLRFRWNVDKGREKLDGIWTGFFEKERIIRKR